MHKHRHTKQSLDPNNTSHSLAFDVICGMEIVQREARFSYTYMGTTYYFCSSTCRQHFKDTPEHYLG